MTTPRSREEEEEIEAIENEILTLQGALFENISLQEVDKIEAKIRELSDLLTKKNPTDL